MNITRISLKHTTENIQIPDWAKTIVIHADTTAPYSEKKLQQIYWLFFQNTRHHGRIQNQIHASFSREIRSS